MINIRYFFMICALLLASCSNGQEPIETVPTAVPLTTAATATTTATTKAVPPTPTSTASTTISDPTATSAADVATATAIAATADIPTRMVQPTATLPQPTATPSPTATAMPTPSPTVDTFHQDTSFPDEAVRQLWTAPDGHVWAITDAALYVQGDDAWVQEQTGQAVILGTDHERRVWVRLGEDTLAFYTAVDGWQRYGPAWDTAVLTHPDEAVTGLAVDNLGRVWLAYGRNGLFRFDPAHEQWQILQAADVGYGPPPAEDIDSADYDPNLAFTDVVRDDFGNIWVSACPLLVYSEGMPLQQLRDGDGVRWFDGQTWSGPQETADRCIWDMALDQAGQLWFAGPKNDLWSGIDDFLTYHPDTGWERLSVPGNEALYGERPSFASRVVVGSTGIVWVFVERRGGASFPPPSVYFWQDGRRQALADALEGVITFAPNDDVWVYAWGLLSYNGEFLPGLQRYQAGIWTSVPIPPHLFRPESMMAVDGNGRLWLTGPDRKSLYYYVSQP